MNPLRIVVSIFAALIKFELVFGAIVTTCDGSIEGTTMQSRRGLSFDAFMQIPFAKPPIGELRFKDPLPNDPWSDTLNCTEFGPACPQVAGLVTSISENCLHLNVFTKSLPGSGSDPKPVIVFIHGGGFFYGSAIISTPIVLMDRDIVFVTINYRMGIFGFLATGTREAPGNAGMKDQVLALKWIKRNIAAFGGDDENITVWGMSAGAFSVTAHLVSPLSRGLFNQIIAMSGSISSPRNLTNNLLGIAKTVATGLNCSADCPAEIIDCLKNKTLEEIVVVPVYSPGEYETCPIFPWWPVIEPDFGQERFLVDQPTHLFECGDFYRVPTIMGIVSNEFASVVPGLLRNSLLMAQLNENFERTAPLCFLYEEGTETSRALSKSLRETYFPYDVLDVRSFEDLNHLISDSIIGYPTHLFTELASDFTDVYYYKFSYYGRFSLFNYPRNEPYSVAHGDDLHYLIPYTFIPTVEVDDQDNFIVERLLSIYENFAKNGNPNNLTDPNLSNMVWPLFNKADAYYLDMDRQLVEKHGLYLNRFARWENVNNTFEN